MAQSVSTKRIQVRKNRVMQRRRQVKICGVDTYGERRARAYNGGLEAEPPAGSRAEALVRKSGGPSPPEAENLLASGCATEAANLPHSPQFANSLNPRHL